MSCGTPAGPPPEIGPGCTVGGNTGPSDPRFLNDGATTGTTPVINPYTKTDCTASHSIGTGPGGSSSTTL